jgi:Tfp pilus assembly protein PilP
MKIPRFYMKNPFLTDTNKSRGLTILFASLFLTLPPLLLAALPSADGVKPQAPPPTQQTAEPQQSDNLISFHFQKMDIRTALHQLTKQSHQEINLVLSDNVSGKISLNLHNVPWNLALEAILGSVGLDKWQSGQVLYIDKKAIIEQCNKNQTYAGEPLSVHVHKLELHTALTLIADLSGFNLIVPDSITGDLTLRLDNIPWDQAIDLIMKAKGLGMRQYANILTIAQQAHLQKGERMVLGTFVKRAMDYRSSHLSSDSSTAPKTAETFKLAQPNCWQPEPNRNRVDAELVSLESLKMKGFFKRNQTVWGILVNQPNGTVYKVQRGDYVGQNYGKVLNITEDLIELKEMVDDGKGCFQERKAFVKLESK